VAAIKAAQLGLRSAMVEKNPTFGGTCLNVGCIPTKVMIHSSEVYNSISHVQDHGVMVDSFHFDMGRMHKRKKRVVTKLTKGVAYLLKKNNVATFPGTGSFVDPHTIAVTGEDGTSETITGRNIIISTGSAPKELPHIQFNGDTILNSTDMLNLESPPETLAVIGAGAVGLEFASIYAFLGTRVTIVEMLPHLLPLEDEEISLELEKAFKKRKITAHLNSTVENAIPADGGVTLKIKSRAGEVQEISCEKVLQAVGRAPFTKGLSLENAGLETEKGFIPVNKYCRTGKDHIYAIGDVAGDPMLAHKATHE